MLKVMKFIFAGKDGIMTITQTFSHFSSIIHTMLFPK